MTTGFLPSVFLRPITSTPLRPPHINCPIHRNRHQPYRHISIRSTVISQTATSPPAVTTPIPAPSIPTAPSPPLQGPYAVFTAAAQLGTTKMRLSWSKVFLLGILAGCYIALGALLALSVGGAIPGILSTNPGLQRFIFGAIGLPVGLWLVVSAGGELFTGNVVLGTSAMLGKKIVGNMGRVEWKDVVRNWMWSYIGNFAGSLMVVGLVVASGVLGVGSASAMTSVGIAVGKVGMTWSQAFWRGVGCNWFVCLAVYLAVSVKSIPGKFVAVWLPVSSFVAMGFDHSVANMFLIPMGMALGAKVSTKAFLLANLIPVTLGNLVGGAFLVAFAYFLGYVKK